MGETLSSDLWSINVSLSSVMKSKNMCLVFLYQVVLLVMLFGSEVNRSESLDSPIDFFRDVCVDQKFTNAFFLIEKKSFSGV